MELEKQIQERMLSNETFQFADLHRGLHDDAYRAADKMLQRFRKAGYASFIRQGRKYIWSLTPDGRAHLRSVIAKAGA